MASSIPGSFLSSKWLRVVIVATPSCDKVISTGPGSRAADAVHAMPDSVPEAESVISVPEVVPPELDNSTYEA